MSVFVEQDVTDLSVASTISVGHRGTFTGEKQTEGEIYL